jgi:hypothetical protein
VRFLATGAAGSSGLGPAKILDTRQFVGGVIDHFKRARLGRGVGAHLVNLPRKKGDDVQSEQLHQQRCDHAAIGESAERRFAGQARAGAGKCRADGSDETLPSRRPLNQQLGCVVKLDDPDFVELESLTQFRLLLTLTVRRPGEHHGPPHRSG